MVTAKRVELFRRLPELYRTKDAEQSPPDQLRDYLALVEAAFGHIHENIEALYHDLFIETCDEWVIPYIGDLLGTGHLKGDPWTLRADVADTIALRRRKGTLGAVELLTYNLTEWGVHCVELFENLVWNQHLNHQRPDEGGPPPYGHQNAGVKPDTPVRGGTVTLRNPSTLSLLGTPFDPFAHTADVRPPDEGQVRYNLPNLAIFLWRLEAYRVRVSRPVHKQTVVTAGALTAVRFSVNPVDRPLVGVEKEREPVRLFNTNLVAITEEKRRGSDALDRSRLAPSVTLIDETPGPVPLERLVEPTSRSYVSVETYDATGKDPKGLDLSDVGFQLHLPEAQFAGETYPPAEGQTKTWKIRGENLCAWEKGIRPPLKPGELAIDPVLGRFVVGLTDPVPAQRLQALEEDLLVTYTYGAPGPVGAHPHSHPALTSKWDAQPSQIKRVNGHADASALVKALKDVSKPGGPVVIIIEDSLVHKLDLSDPLLTNDVEPITLSLLLDHSVVIRAGDNQRPVIQLEKQPLGFRPVKVVGADAKEQAALDAAMANLTVRLEGLYLTRGAGFPADGDGDRPLINRAALNSLELVSCTLDPGGYRTIHSQRTEKIERAPLEVALKLEEDYGFDAADEETAFDQVPLVLLQRTITGALLVDQSYRLNVTDTIIDAGRGVGDTSAGFAVASASDPPNDWGPPAFMSGVTVFGRTRVESIEGRGGIWVHALEVMDTQRGCIRYSYFSGEPSDRLPQNLGCVKGTEARLRFTSEFFGEPGYAQLARAADSAIRERGPGDDAMGAYGFLLESHKWRNLQIRFREFMPVGIRPLPIPVT
jgi:hypothetical protein